jgi:hypothetical protein
MAVRVQSSAAVASQERDGSELRVIDDEVVCWQLDCRRRHQGLERGHGWSSSSRENQPTRRAQPTMKVGAHHTPKS